MYAPRMQDQTVSSMQFQLESAEQMKRRVPEFLVGNIGIGTTKHGFDLQHSATTGEGDQYSEGLAGGTIGADDFRRAESSKLFAEIGVPNQPGLSALAD